MSNHAERHKILVVDDAPENIHLLIDVLGDDYAIIVATDGPSALELAAAAPQPDLILLDVMMPGMDGYEVCSHLRDDPATAGIPIIFITKLSDEADERKGLELSAVDYIHKPFSPSLVRARVRNHLELKEYRDRLEELVHLRTRELHLTQSAAIFGLAILAEYRNLETGLHIKRTQSYVRILAEHLSDNPRFRGYFDRKAIQRLCDSAPLHDIGKVGVPDNILLKPTRLTNEEFEIMKLHTAFGRDVVCRIELGMNDAKASSFLRLAEEFAYTHHEHWNGTGYYRMKGDEIPVPGRLMAMADVYDALTSERSYKAAISHEQAFRIITEGDGRTEPEHFDPDILQAFIDIHDKFRRIAVANQESCQDTLRR
jgi:putative two-component system response regulator